MPRREEQARRDILAQETSRVSLRHQAPMEVVLVYPDAYPVGISNLGFQTVFAALNALDGVRCERAFFDPSRHGAPCALESGRPLSRFDVVAFSLSFEMDYPHVVAALYQSAIPPLAQERVRPFVLAGGVCAFSNPVPLSPFVDAFLIGEAEGMLEHMVAALADIRRRPKSQVLHALSQIPGMYVPAVRAQQPAPPPIERQYARNLEQTETYSVLTSPLAPFGSTFLIETGRGCARGCRFCLAGCVYRPARARPMDALLRTVRENAAPGQRIGVIGAALSDYPALTDLCVRLVDEGHPLALSSLRADCITPRLVDALVRGGARTLTIAPEAGSERLRTIINKHLDTPAILEAATAALQGGIQKLRLYFMIGLPFEATQDVQAIVSLVGAVVAQSGQKGASAITVSLHPFVPKPATPFQWAAMPSLRELEERCEIVRKGLRGAGGVGVKRASLRGALVQALLSAGDQQTGLAIYHRVVEGMPWQQAFRKAGVDRDAIHREKGGEAAFAWDFIRHPLTKQALWEEYQRAKTFAETHPGQASP